MNINELDNETLTKLGIKELMPKERTTTKKPMLKDTVRGHASAVMGVLSKISQSDRKRVLEQALKMNEV